MKRKGAAGLSAVYRLVPAANEEFAGTANAGNPETREHTGWDPFEVWRTRVKESASLKREHELDSLR
jgi:hypothetical protein